MLATLELNATAGFIKAGMLAELQEQRVALLHDIISHCRPSCRRWAGHRQV